MLSADITVALSALTRANSCSNSIWRSVSALVFCFVVNSFASAWSRALSASNEAFFALRLSKAICASCWACCLVVISRSIAAFFWSSIAFCCAFIESIRCCVSNSNSSLAKSFVIFFLAITLANARPTAAKIVPLTNSFCVSLLNISNSVVAELINPIKKSEFVNDSTIFSHATFRLFLEASRPSLYLVNWAAVAPALRSEICCNSWTRS